MYVQRVYGPLASFVYIWATGLVAKPGSLASIKKSVKFVGWIFFWISLGSPRVHPMGLALTTCEEPSENRIDHRPRVI